MSPDKSKAPIDKSIDQDIAEYERQFREILEHCPGGRKASLTNRRDPPRTSD